MSQQPEALRLADELSQAWHRPQAQTEASAMLRNQHAEIERLRDELTALRGQEPVAWMNVRNGFICKKPTNADYQQPLYLAAGAQPEPDANCITLPDGSCVGGLMAGKPPCMHDRPSGAQPAPIPADAAQDLLAACKEFVRKVEAGEARSVRSYEQMKAAITKAENVQPAPSVPVEYVTDTTHEKVMDAIAVALGDAYDCLRVWGAWSYGTMSQDDFVQVVEQQDRLVEIADAAIRAMLASGAQPASTQEVYDWPEGATHYQPQQKAFYKRVSACEWYVWSRITDEPLHWSYSPGTIDSAEWIVRAQPALSVPEVTDAMALAFHGALTDGGVGVSEVEEIKVGLRAALAVAQLASTEEHITDGSKCWCNPDLVYKDIKTGAEVWVHRRGKQ